MYPEAEAQLRVFAKVDGQNGDAKALLARGVADPMNASRRKRAWRLRRTTATSDRMQFFTHLSRLIGRTGPCAGPNRKLCGQEQRGFVNLLWNRTFDPLRDEPRFKAALAKLGLPYTPSGSQNHERNAIFLLQLKRHNVYKVAVRTLWRAGRFLRELRRFFQFLMFRTGRSV